MIENAHKEEHIADLEQATIRQALSGIRWTGFCPGTFMPLSQAGCLQKGLSDSSYKMLWQISN